MPSQAESSEAGLNARRSLLRNLIRGFLSLWAFAAAGVGFSFLKVPARDGGGSKRRHAGGSLSSLAVGAARFVRSEPDPFFVIRVSQTEVMALSAICPYARCVLKRDTTTGGYSCPCHGHSFDSNGNVLSGPATQPLVRYQAEVRLDQIIVRT